MRVAVKVEGEITASITWTLFRINRKGTWKGMYWIDKTPEKLGEILFSQTVDGAKLIPPKISVGGGTTRFLLEIQFTGTLTAYEVL
jgi:hypothetical protein